MATSPAIAAFCLLAGLCLWGAAPTAAFVAVAPLPPAVAAAPRAGRTRVFIDRRTAELIDREDYRQRHKREFEAEWMRQNRAAVLSSLHGGDGGGGASVLASDLPEQQEQMRQVARDRKLARDDPQRYCADRCVATGNCDVYEDFFHFSPTEVLQFCNDCVMGEGEEPCDIPEGFYDGLMP